MKVQTAAIVVLVVAGVGTLLWLAVSGMQKTQADGRHLDETLVAEYCGLVAQGRAGDAYDRCFNRGYQRQATRQEFVAAHEKRRSELGALLDRRLLLVEESRNLFSRERRLQLRYELRYEKTQTPQVLYLVADDTDGAFLIEGTYRETAGETFDALIW